MDTGTRYPTTLPFKRHYTGVTTQSLFSVFSCSTALPAYTSSMHASVGFPMKASPLLNMIYRSTLRRAGARAFGNVRDVSKETLKATFAASSGPVVIDVREPAEIFQTGSLNARVLNIPLGKILPNDDLDCSGALTYDPDEFETEYGVEKPRKTDEIIFTCKAGKRSLFAAMYAQELGYENAMHYPGGSDGWFA